MHDFSEGTKLADFNYSRTGIKNRLFKEPFKNGTYTAPKGNYLLYY